MQAAFLISSKSFSEKQVGVLFFVFSLFQFLALAPAGYFLDYSSRKIEWVIWAGCGCSILTVVTAMAARDFGENMGLMIILKMLQGTMSAIVPPGFNGITLGIVGSTGFTHQVSRNRMMNHLGTALIVGTGSLLAYFLFPNIGQLFMVSPISALGLYYNLRRIRRSHIDRDAARGLIITSPTMKEYEHMDEEKEVVWISTYKTMADDPDSRKVYPSLHNNASPYTPPEQLIESRKEGGVSTSSTESSEEKNTKENIHQTIASDQRQNSRLFNFGPSFDFEWVRSPVAKFMAPPAQMKPQSPLSVLMEPRFLIFTFVIFGFHLANSSVLPLVMQSLSLKDPQAGILLSGLCIVIAQTFMSGFAKICGDYSPTWGRKNLLLIGLISLPIRCWLLTILLSYEDNITTDRGSVTLKALILSTQLLDSVGAGILGTLYVLITNDISIGTGRFSLMLGITTGSMCLGGTISGYIGQSFASDYGYPAAFKLLGTMSLVPVFIFAAFVPETLPDFARSKPKRRPRVEDLIRRLHERQKSIRNPFAFVSVVPETQIHEKSHSLKTVNAAHMELV